MNVNWECCRLLFKRKERKETVRLENSIVSPYLDRNFVPPPILRQP